MVNGQNNTHRKKPKLALPTSKFQDNVSDTLNPFTDNQTPSFNNTNGNTSPPPFYTKRPNNICLARLKLFPKRSTHARSTINYRTSMLPSSSEQNPTLPNYSNDNAI